MGAGWVPELIWMSWQNEKLLLYWGLNPSHLAHSQLLLTTVILTALITL
jgi:hypothetical protein